MITGLGATLALQGSVAVFSSSVSSTNRYGDGYAYGFLGFIGINVGLIIGTGL